MSIFKKEAQDFWPPGVPRPTSAPASVAGPVTKAPAGEFMPPMPGGKSKPTPVGSVKLNVSVQNMQKAIQELSRKIAGEKIDPETKQLVSNNNNFNNFLGNHYVKSLEQTTQKSDEPADPITPVIVPTTQSIMQALSKLDNNKVFTPDGAWGPKTNDALKNIYTFAYSLLQLVGDLGLPDNTIYNSTWLNAFKDKLSGYTFDNKKISLNSEDQKNRADSLVKHINAIGRLYDSIKQQVSSKPELRSYIEEKKPFENYTQVGLNLTPEEDQFSRTTTNIPTMPYSAPRLERKRLDYIPVKYLRSKKDYLDWMMGYAGVPNEAEAIRIFNSFIKRKIENN